MSKAIEELKAIFDVEESFVSTGVAQNSPTELTREIASQLIQKIDLSVVLRDIGIIVAREISSELEKVSLRAADYADLPDMPQMVAARLGSELSVAPNDFVNALLEQIKLRG